MVRRVLLLAGSKEDSFIFLIYLFFPAEMNILVNRNGKRKTKCF